MKVYGAPAKPSAVKTTVYAVHAKTGEVVKVTATAGQVREDKKLPRPPNVVAEAVIPVHLEVERPPLPVITSEETPEGTMFTSSDGTQVLVTPQGVKIVDIKLEDAEQVYVDADPADAARSRAQTRTPGED